MKSSFPSTRPPLVRPDLKETFCSVFGGLLISAIYRLLSPALTSAEAQAHNAHIDGLSGDVDSAERGLRQALDINPRLALAHHWTGIWSLHKGQIEAALAAVRRAQALEPLAPIFSANLGMIYYPHTPTAIGIRRSAGPIRRWLAQQRTSMRQLHASVTIDHRLSQPAG
jgi:tetratricopeptide (TPR) repeat protein